MRPGGDGSLKVLQCLLQGIKILQQFIQSVTQNILVMNIKNLATYFGSLNHPQANFSNLLTE